MLVLGVESTCDETGVAVVKDGKEIFSNVVATQVDLHNIYGGVVPELACRRHVDVIIPVLREALEKAEISLKDIDGIAVSIKPGLIGALMIGLNCAKALSFALGVPYVGVNHVEAHIYAALMEYRETLKFPCLGVVLSGGHTALVEIQTIGQYLLLGQTVDDAIGEAFDKVAKMLGQPYPGGPRVEKLAQLGDPFAYGFKAGKVKEKPYHFSFSGIKTSVLYTITGQNSEIKRSYDDLSDQEKCNIAASFQHAVFEDLLGKISALVKNNKYEAVVFGGGVTNNRTLRELAKKTLSDSTLIWPSSDLTLDNAAMIAGLGYHELQMRPEGDSLTVEPIASISTF